ncbi:hypothetical protein JQN58_02020 [Aneurinibacillus sp. BA2021]|nr:hypothetical protein [Aneurinibacillus sp. BA2021]
MRKVEWTDDALILHFTGLTSVAALKKEIKIPYSSIENVESNGFDISAFHFRIGTSGIGKNLREGRFLQNGEWIFLSYLHHEKVVVLTLKNHDYKKVVFEVEEPEQMREQIMKKVLENREEH